jgi:inosine-uridine nucleoside N-ribohydrolase
MNPTNPPSRHTALCAHYAGPVPRPLLLDCDPGIDDMIAILVACASPEIDLLGVSTVGGNAGIETTTRNARAVLALAGRPDVPVAAGASRSLVRTAGSGATHVHGDNGLGGVQLPEPETPPDPRHAVDFLADLMAGAAEPVTLVATGPLTNVALLYARHPDVAATLDRLVIMGGSIGAGNTTPAAEFNIWFDPEAAYRVLTDPGLSRAVPTTMVGLDVTYRTSFGLEDLARLRAANRIGALAADALDHYRQEYAELLGRPVVPVHDAVAVAVAVRPDLVVTRPGYVDVDTGCGPSRGNTVIDLHGKRGAAPNAEVALDADPDTVVGFLLDRLGSLRETDPSSAGTGHDPGTR